MQKSCEIMAPVSNEEMLQAAIHSQADSVYIGMPDFNARGRADQISDLTLKNLIETARLYGVKSYIAFNILIFEDEMKKALSRFSEINKFDPDAWIIQDIGLAVLIKKFFPEVSLHASTQATIVSPFDINFYGDLFDRYTLARELSLSEIEKIAKSTRKELEVFIHGSLCISYSGQCFTSAGFGGRSANRGECAQSCRHEYDLYIDKEKTDTGGKYLVSPRDLMAPDIAPLLSSLGVSALKIEGRLKSPEYVASAVELYRHKLNKDNSRKYPQASRLTFSRNASNGWLSGHDYSGLIQNDLNTHSGIYLGKIKNISENFFEISAPQGLEINNGDGILLKNSAFESGGFIFHIKKNQKGSLEISMSRDFPLKKLNNKMNVYLTSSHRIEKEIRKTFTDREALKKIPITIDLSGRPGDFLTLRIKDRDKNEIILKSESPVEKALNKPLDLSLVKKEVSALSSSPFISDELQIDISPDSFIPNAILKKLRQEAVQLLTEKRKETKNSIPVVNLQNEILENPFENRISPNSDNQNNIFILVRNPSQLNVILENYKAPSLLKGIYLDYTYGHPYSESIKKIKKAGLLSGIASMRVYKPGEEKQIELLMKSEADILLIRNASALEYIKEKKTETVNMPDFIADFSLNITNSFSFEYFLRKGFKRITGSYDLVFDEGKNQDPGKLISFIKDLPSENIEVCLRYFLPSFYMDYCLFSRYLASGKDSTSCGFPCTKHDLHLKDRKGLMHPVIADQNCRNEMFNGIPKEITSYLPRFIENGARNFRIELGPDENDSELIRSLLWRILDKADQN